MALRGQGIVLKPVWEIASYLRSGDLQPILTDFPPEPLTLAVIYPHRRFLSARVRVFADFMLEHGAKAIETCLDGFKLESMSSSPRSS